MCYEIQDEFRAFRAIFDLLLHFLNESLLISISHIAFL